MESRDLGRYSNRERKIERMKEIKMERKERRNERERSIVKMNR